MSTIQKILLAAACLLFALTVYSFFRFDIYITIMLFLLHCLCLILFCYKTYAFVKEDRLSMETYHQDIGMEIAGKNREVELLNEKMSEKEEENKRLSIEKEDYREKYEKLEDRVKDLEEEKAALEELEKKERERAEGRGDYGALLPPLEAEGEEGTIDLVAIANTAREELLDDAVKANMAISISCATEKLMVKADRNRLLILFRNIIDNSIKYMKKAGSLVITLSTIGDDIFIVLKDTGEGLPEDETKHVFELNFQGSNRISGNGLGLTQAKAIVDYYGGVIYARSDEGRGMGIYIQLPARV